MRALLASDSFKGTLTSAEVAAELARGIERAGWVADVCPLADGGEGTGAVLARALGGERVPARATDPLGRAVEAGWWRLANGAAVLDVAEASGLWRIQEGERDALAASSRGTGELILAAAAEAGEVLVAVGGSATTDGGAGALAVIADAGGIGTTRIRCLCDVSTPFERAAEVFGPQKGADAEALAVLAARLDDLAAGFGRDPRGVPFSGAAGGLAGGLWAQLAAELEPGAAFVCDLLRVDERAARANLVIGGEGSLDSSTLEGKALSELAKRCERAGTPLHAVVGRDGSDPRVRELLALQSVTEAGTTGALEAAAFSLASAV